MTIISNLAIKELQGNKRFIAKMSYHFDKTANTIGNWIRNRDAMLTTPDAIKIISEETGLTQEQILEEEIKNLAEQS